MQDGAASRESRFDSLVERQSRFVFRVAYAVLRNPESAEDVVQETFLKLYRSRSWEDVENERAFLARAAWRLAVDRVSKKRWEQAECSGFLAREANPEDLLLTSDWVTAVHRLLDTLPEELRQVLALSGLEAMNSREIGETTGVPEGTVRTRLQRARQLMKQKMAEMERSRCGK